MFCDKVDEAMQEFASKCCQHNAAQPPATACIMNADGVYLATYAALLLTLKQRRTSYYNESSVSIFKHNSGRLQIYEYSININAIDAFKMTIAFFLRMLYTLTW